ncbi:MAG TPA: DUF2939 domain-containing protein [Hyphomicrobiaceae bacterium]|nr:DUF2939 domain-containing protein [Hyphomicrobiaceae bacterium]
MARKAFIALAVLLALAGFYVAWPAYTGHVIGQALKAGDAAALERKIDFPRVRESLKSHLVVEVERKVAGLKEDGSGLRKLVAGRLTSERVRRTVASTVDTIVTPTSVIRISQQGRTLKQAIERGLLEQLSGSLGTGDDGRKSLVGSILGRFSRRSADAAAGAPPTSDDDDVTITATGRERRYGLANVKHVTPTGALSFEVGVNRDPGAPWPELLVELAFTGFDWRVVRITPVLDR